MPSGAPNQPLQAQDALVGRQPILDRGQQVCAYELLFRSSLRNRAEVVDNAAATSTVISHVFGDLGLETALGQCKGYINVDAVMLMSDALELLPKGQVVLELLESETLTPELIARCRELRASGFQVALDDVVDASRVIAIADAIDVVKVDLLGMERGDLARLTAQLKRIPVQLLAEKVDSLDQFSYCHELGYDLFQGYYFAKPQIIAGKKLSHSELTLLRLLGMVMADADTVELENAFKGQPGLSVNLVRLTNSAAAGVRTRIGSVRQAIAVLGRRQLQRWLQLLVYTSPTAPGGSGSPLMQLAAGRGRFLELLAARLSRKQAVEDSAFMTGIMSLMPALLSVPMEEILRGLPVDAAVRQALLQRGGILGAMLSLAEGLEGGDSAGSFRALSEIGDLSADDVCACQNQALAWVHSIEHEAD